MKPKKRRKPSVPMRRRRGKPPEPPIKLRKCPFCGIEAGKLTRFRLKKKDPEVFVIDCENCHGGGPVMGGNLARAKVAWNHRDGPPDLFNATNRGVPEVIYGEESAEDRKERMKSGDDPAKEVPEPVWCPFCHSDEIYVESGKIGRKDRYYYAFCGVCESVGPAHDSSEDFAVLAWNTRAKC